MKEEHPECLSPKIQALWEGIGGIGERYILVGGTALAYRIGHRISVDMDILTSAPLEHPRVLREKIGASGLGKHRWVRRKPDHYIKFFETEASPKIDVHGKSRLPCLERPGTASNGLKIASLQDLLFQKMLASARRGEARDFGDLKAISLRGCEKAENACAALSWGDWGLERDEAEDFASLLEDSTGLGGNLAFSRLGRMIRDGLDRKPEIHSQKVEGGVRGKQATRRFGM